MLKSPFLALFAVAFFGSPALAEMSAEDFLQGYDGGNSQQRTFYEQMLGANENGMSWANTSLAHDGSVRIYCAPKNMVITDQQSVAILRQHVMDHPNDARLPFGLVLLQGLKETFPCK
jgi:hypothetical protein